MVMVLKFMRMMVMSMVKGSGRFSRDVFSGGFVVVVVVLIRMMPILMVKGSGRFSRDIFLTVVVVVVVGCGVDDDDDVHVVGERLREGFA